jgi:pantoate--beta-alanine ligase
MGALHAGHMALLAEARQRGARVVASIFVNPTQFGPGEDLARYPRREAEDAAMLEREGCDLLWAPDAGTMYPAGYSTSVRVSGLTASMEGASRPGHFDGVATVVTKLLNQVRPDLALFGEKDFQQLAVIRTLVRDLDMGVEIIGVPTQRDADGLALSSRNIFLSADQRIAARALPRALLEGAQRLQGGADVEDALASAGASLEEAGFSSPDYVQLCDPDTLQPLDRLDRPARFLIAARLGTTRLLDNVAVEKQ